MKYAIMLLLAFAGTAYGQQCIDSDGDGWGWDGSASCRVTPTLSSGCDYTNAGSNGGWGWDQVNGVSCPPVGQAQTELDGIASAIVGTWVCDEELFIDGVWIVEKGTEDFNGVLVDMFTQRATFNADGSYFAEVGYNRNTGQYESQSNFKWSLNGFRFSIDVTNFSQIGFGGNSFYMYYEPTRRRACSN